VLLLLAKLLLYQLLLAECSQLLLLRQATHSRLCWPLLLLHRHELLLLPAYAQHRRLFLCQGILLLRPGQLLLSLHHRCRGVMQLQAQRHAWELLQQGRTARHKHPSITLSS
jgi:hypothetical protein